MITAADTPGTLLAIRIRSSVCWRSAARALPTAAGELVGVADGGVEVLAAGLDVAVGLGLSVNVGAGVSVGVDATVGEGEAVGLGVGVFVGAGVVGGESCTQKSAQAARREPASEIDPREARRYTGRHKKNPAAGIAPSDRVGGQDSASRAPGHQAGCAVGRNTGTVSFSGRAAQTRPSPAKMSMTHGGE